MAETANFRVSGVQKMGKKAKFQKIPSNVWKTYYRDQACQELGSETFQIRKKWYRKVKFGDFYEI